MNVSDNLVNLWKRLGSVVSERATSFWDDFAGPDYNSGPYEPINSMRREVEETLAEFGRIELSKLNTILQEAQNLPRDGYTAKLATWGARLSSIPQIADGFANLWYDSLCQLSMRGRAEAMEDARKTIVACPCAPLQLKLALAALNQLDKGHVMGRRNIDKRPVL